MLPRIIAEGIPDKELKSWVKEKAAVYYPGNRYMHVKQVKRIAFQLLGEVQRLGLFQFDKHAANVLYTAAILHDAGYTAGIGDLAHEVFSMQAILLADVPGLSEKEKNMAALVAYYHRSDMPDESNIRFTVLSHKDQSEVRMLAAILKIADVLDRDHRQHVKSVALIAMHDSYTLRIVINKKKKYDFKWSPFEGMTRFMERLEQKSLLFKRETGRPLRISFEQE